MKDVELVVEVEFVPVVEFMDYVSSFDAELFEFEDVVEKVVNVYKEASDHD